METAQKLQRRIRRIEWDGADLCVVAGGDAGVIRVEIDGAIFAPLDDRAADLRTLHFDFAPGGQSCMNASFVFDDGTRTLPVGLQWGKPGIAAAIADRPLRPLADSRLVDTQQGIDALRRAVTIVVPVYNAPDLVRACLDSVLAHSTGPARLIVIDDASTDPAVAPLLARYAGLAGVQVLTNASNRGFTATVNHGMALAGDDDVVLLNADAQVAACWLDGLRRAICADPQTASATAVSDNAGAFSVPELERENPLPAMWTFEQAACALWQGAGTAYPRLPTGNGFCMYLRRAAIDVVGMFDAEAFAEGYGEENDWSQRAEAAGWHHVVVGNVMVRHARSMSFGHDRRARLGAQGMQVLRTRWPNYEAAVGATLFSFRRRVLDWRVRRIYAAAAMPGPLPLPRLLCADEALADAAIAAEAPFELWRLRRVAAGCWLEQRVASGWVEREHTPTVTGLAACSDLLRADLHRWLQIHAIELFLDAAANEDLTGMAAALGIATARIDALTPVATAILGALCSMRSFAQVST
ncbi:MAG: glycosyltransferase [Tahibacter sp.]